MPALPTACAVKVGTESASRFSTVRILLSVSSPFTLPSGFIGPDAASTSSGDGTLEAREQKKTVTMKLVLIWGLTRESRHWGAMASPNGVLVRHLASLPQAAMRAVVTLDLPGNGRFHAERSPSSVQEMVELARARLLADGHAPPYTLVAMSLGAMVATHWAQRYPAEAYRLILINTSLRPYATLGRRLRPASWLPLAQAALRWSREQHAERVERVLHRLTCRRLDTRASDIAAWTEIRRSAPVSPGNALRQLWAAARFRSANEPPHCRTLLLSSAGDALVHPQCSSAIATQWRAGHYQHPWAGHDLPHDDPEWVSARIAGWLAQP